MSTLEQLQKILMRDYKVSAEQLAPDAQISALGIDSLGVIELMFQIEEQFGITLADDDSTAFVTIDDVVRHVDQLLLVQRPGEKAAIARAQGVT